MPHRAEKYISDIQNRRLSVPNDIRKAIKRHLDDLKKSRKTDYPYYFSPTHAKGAIEAVEVQRLAYGEKAGEPFVLMPWQATILYMAYGWRKKKDHSRRFQKAYIKVPRGNAKTEFLAAVGNIGFFFENVKDPQIWWVSSTVTQSQIGFTRQKEMARYLIEEDPTFNELYGLRAQRIYEKVGGGYVGFLSSKPKDGFSPFYGLVDEYHEFADDARIHSLESGMIKRANPFTWIITTAGVNPECPCAQFEKRCKAMLNGDAQNDALLAFIYDIDEGDDWNKEEVWKKVNPSWGVSVYPDAFRAEYQKAVAEGIVKENNFKAKNLNIWGTSRAAWIRDDTFRASGRKFDPEILNGALCFGGLDLSYKDDMTCLALLFPPQYNEIKSSESVSGTTAGEFKVLLHYWCPEATAYERNRLDGVPYLQWTRDSWLHLTPGDTIDYEYIKAEIRKLRLQYNIHSIANDPWRETEVIKDLDDEFGIQTTQSKRFFEPFAQTARMMTAPLVEMERMVKKKLLNHGRNPILEWNNRNVVIYQDGNGNFKLDKKNSKEKIDGMVALGMAVGQYLTYKHTITEAYSKADVYIL